MCAELFSVRSAAVVCRVCNKNSGSEIINLRSESTIVSGIYAIYVFVRTKPSLLFSLVRSEQTLVSLLQALRAGKNRRAIPSISHMGYHGEPGGGLASYSHHVKQLPSEAEIALDHHQWSTPAAVAINSLRATARSTPSPAPSPAPASVPVADADPSDVVLVDLGSRSLITEDLEKALRLWTQPAILIAGRNSLDRLPANVPGTILYLDLSFNR